MLNKSQIEKQIEILQKRFEKNVDRHKSIKWLDILKALEGNKHSIEILIKMEETGGEPDVIGWDQEKKKFIYCDCSSESPSGRRSLCYDQKSLDDRKEAKPSGSALEVAGTIGIEILTESQYRHLQTLGEFDTKTSSWIATPKTIRDLGGALFADRRYNSIFVYHNGASSYYAARGFRGILLV